MIETQEDQHQSKASVRGLSWSSSPANVKHERNSRHSACFQPLRRGTGQAPAHHGELVQGVLAGRDGRLRRCLTTLLHFPKGSTASFESDGSAALRVEPAFKKKALRAARATLAHLRFPQLGGLLKIYSDIPIGRGMGSSTADCLAAIKAVAAAFGRRLPLEIQSRLVVDSEGASDGIMYPDQAVIFAHREGVLLEPLGPLPSFEALGFDSDPDGHGVDTLELKPARYSSREIEAFRVVFMALRRGVKLQDAALIGRAATASAVINQRFLPKPRFDELLAIVDRTGCLGLQVAHSGTVLGLLLDNTAADHQARVAQVRRHLAEIGFSTTWRFNTLVRPAVFESPSPPSGIRFGDLRMAADPRCGPAQAWRPESQAPRPLSERIRKRSDQLRIRSPLGS